MVATGTPGLPPPLERPREIACVLTEHVWPLEDLESIERGRQFLRFEAGGRPFAELMLGTDVELVIPAALSTAGGMLKIFSNGVWMNGHMEAIEMPLYPAVPFVMSGVFIPNHERRLVWQTSRPGFITVVTEQIPRLLPAEHALVAERACSDISLRTTIFEDRAIDKVMKTKAGPAETKPPWAWLRSGKVEVSAEPDGQVMAQIDVVEPRDDTMLIHPPRILAMKKDWTRMALRTYGGVVFGWVKSDRIEKSKKEYLDLSHDSRTLRIYQGRAEGNFIACDREIPLVAEVGSERRTVGTIQPLAPFEPAPPNAGWSSVVFRDAGLLPTGGASFLVRESDLANCKPAPPRPPPK